ncbi:MAG: glycosyltransferase [Pedobacter sp.]|nr:MAG: glycosyltransferase [Pedobacter sp.]
MMSVAYITWSPFLDFSIEYIGELKKGVNLHVYVVLNDIFLKTAILDIDKYSYQTGEIIKLEQLEGIIENYNLFKEYADGCQSFNFILFPHKNLSFPTFQSCRKLAMAINLVNPSIIHFDDINLQLISMRLFLKCKNIITNIHDPEPHSGEGSWKMSFARKCLFPIMKAFIVFSDYSRIKFQEIYGEKHTLHKLSLTPYYFYSKIPSKRVGIVANPKGITLMFFGRISAYKGVDNLLASFERTYKDNPHLNLIIAGKGDIKSEIPTRLKDEIGKRLIIINRFVKNGELVDLMSKIDFVICPYKDATQSGVVMTAFAFKKKVLVTKVGGLFEPVIDGVNGYVYPVNSPEMLDEILRSLTKEDDKPNEFFVPTVNTLKNNIEKLVEIYHGLI